MTQTEQIRDCLNDPREVLAALGLLSGATKQARGFIVSCPAHDEKSPSCSVQNRKGVLLWKCHGCGAGGDVFALVAAVHRLDARQNFKQVLALAGSICGVDTNGSSPALPRHRLKSASFEEEPQPLDADRFEALCAILARRPAQEDAEVSEYLQRRGLLEACGTALWALPPGAELDALRDEIVSGIGHDGWKRSGLCRANGAWSWTSHRLVIPWTGPGVDGSVYQLQRRTLGVDRPKYVGAKGRQFLWPFGIGDAIEESGTESAVVFVEGALDALAYRKLVRGEHLDRVVVGLPGVKGWRSSWAKLATGRVAVLALDGDRAGEEAVTGIARDLREAGAARVFRERVVGVAKDWAEKVREVAT